MLSAAWGWYYGSNDEELLADCTFKNPYKSKVQPEPDKFNDIIVRPGILGNEKKVNILTEGRKKGEESLLEKCSQQLKLLRHPNIVHFIGCVMMDSEIHLITEHVTPVCSVIQNMDANEICSGLHDIALALQFIHEKAHVTHNNICLQNMFVNKHGVWKLGGFEYACKYKNVNEDLLKLNGNYENICPPEEQTSNKVNLPLKKEQSHCRDVFAFGILLKNFFEQIRFSTQISEENLTEIMLDILREDYENRPNFTEIVSMPIFKSCYIHIVHFLQSVTLQTKLEKDQFFRTLLQKIDEFHIFADVVGRRIIPLLLTPIILAEQAAVDFVINHILTPANTDHNDGILPEEVFALHVIPCIAELFNSRLIHVRVVLMNNFHKYVHLFERSVLDQVVLPEILLGLTDLNNQIVQCSLHALADSVPIVGGDLIVGGEREKVFSLGVPKFDGQALNATSAIATKIVQKIKRKSLPKTNQVEDKPKKQTLLELAKKRQPKTPPKENHFLHNLTRKQREFSKEFKKTNVIKLDPAPCTSKSSKNSVNKPVMTPAPEVETWASSDDDSSVESWNYNERNFGSNSNLYPEDLNLSGSETKVDENPEDVSSSLNEEEVDPYEVSQQNETNNSNPMHELKNLNSKNTESQKNNSLNDSTSFLKEHPKTLKTSKEPKMLNKKDFKQLEHNQHNGPNKLGQEFEIKVKVKPEKQQNFEPDFFADMAPIITSTQNGIKPEIVLKPLHNNALPQELNTEFVTKNSSNNEDPTEVRSVDSGQGSSVSAAFHAIDDHGVVEMGWDTEDW